MTSKHDTSPEINSQKKTPTQALALLQQAALKIGFDQIGVLDVAQPHPALESAGDYLQDWIKKGYHGSMEYMQAHGEKRWRPAALLPGTTRVIALRLHYLNHNTEMQTKLTDSSQAYISRYALGRDYHKTFRQKLKKLQHWMLNQLAPCLEHMNPPESDQPYQGRFFVDSAPVMEKATAQAAGLGWIGKNTLVLDKNAGSWFFLGEIFTNLPIAPTLFTQTAPQPKNHCGSCTRCIEVCPTQAIIAPYTLDARKCISYLTIENKGPIPHEFRKAIGNRIFGCDDCQIFCPWSRFAKTTSETDFAPRHGLESLTITDALSWTPAVFDHKTQGSPIRRTGYAGWLRNLAVAAGNHLRSNPTDLQIRTQLQKLAKAMMNEALLDNADQRALVLEHVEWALQQGKTNEKYST